jgi:hypothetical protein
MVVARDKRIQKERDTMSRSTSRDTQLASFELVELPDGCTVADLEAERVASPRRPWSRTDAEHVLAVLEVRPGYAATLPWRSAR